MIYCTTGELIHSYILAHILQIPVEPQKKKYLNASFKALEKKVLHRALLDCGWWLL
jgi:hypothetical protein